VTTVLRYWPFAVLVASHCDYYFPDPLSWEHNLPWPNLRSAAFVCTIGMIGRTQRLTSTTKCAAPQCIQRQRARCTRQVPAGVSRKEIQSSQ
jgi:hypothetical protein